MASVAIDHFGDRYHNSDPAGSVSPSTTVSSTPPTGGLREDPLSDNYSIQRTIGRGTFAKVKLAIHRPTGMQVAIKCIDKAHLPDEYSVRNLHREARIMKTLHHHHIVRLLEILETKEELYLVMEYVSGGEVLDYIVAHDRLKEPEAKRFTAQIINALEYCHSMCVVHRDLKPENLLIDEQRNIKITDFGLSTVLVQQDTKLSTFCGSPLYSAPELIDGRKYNGPEVDMWGLGVIVYFMVMGHRPFDQRNIAALADAIRHAHYEPLCGVSQGKILQFRKQVYISIDCHQFVEGLLQVDASQRLSLQQAKRHAWLQDVISSTAAINEPVPEQLDHLDENVVNHLADLLHVKAEEICRSVLDDRYDNLAASYYLMVMHCRTLSKMAPVQQSSSTAAANAGRRPSTAVNVAADTTVKQKLSTPPVAANNPGIRRPSTSAAPPKQRARAQTFSLQATTAVAALKQPTSVSGVNQQQQQQQQRPPSAIEVAKKATLRRRRFSAALSGNDPTAVTPLINQFQTNIMLNSPSRRPSTAAGSSVPTATTTTTSRIISLQSASKTTGAFNNSSPVKAGSIRTIRFAFNCSTTSTKLPDEIANIIKHSLNGERIQFSQTGYAFTCVAVKRMPAGFNNIVVSSSGNNDGCSSGSSIEFEIEICQLPRINLNGVKFRRIHGDVWEYKQLCVHLMKVWHL